jgi:hypothetical protein
MTWPYRRLSLLHSRAERYAKLQSFAEVRQALEIDDLEHLAANLLRVVPTC